MDLIITDKLLTIKFNNKSEETEIKYFFTYDDNSHAFSTSGFNHMYVKKVCFIKYLKKSDLYAGFAGLAKELLIYCKEHNIKFTIQDKRTHIEYKEDNYAQYFPFEYNEHQIRALQAMSKTNRGIIQATTSAGKGNIISAFIKLSKFKTLILVDRTLLATQLHERFKKDGIDCGLIGGGSNICKDVTICTIQSVKKLDGRKFECVIQDEVHKGASKSFQEFYKSSEFIWWYGFSGTVFNGDYLDFIKIRQFFGSIICDINAKELMDNKVIAKPNIYFIENKCEETMDWQSAYNLCIVNGKKRNKKIVEINNKYKDHILILVSRIEHGEVIKSLITDSVFLSGEDSNEIRINTIKDFEEGKIKTLVASDIFREGINIPTIQVLILAAGGQGISLSLQRCGRAIRTTENKKEVDIYDFYDIENRFLQKWSNKRKRLYIQQFGKQVIKE
jgi:superfamily II DNA or RNA helicase